MERFLYMPYSWFTCRTLRNTLALLWIGGLIFGFCFGLYAADYLLFLIHIDACSSGYKLLPVILFRILPLLFCCLSFYFSQPFVLFGAVFLRAIIFSSAIAIFYFTSGGSAWLVSVFVFLEDALILSAFWFFLLSSFEPRLCRQTVLISVITTFFATLFDYLYIAPFMAKLI